MLTQIRAGHPGFTVLRIDTKTGRVIAKGVKSKSPAGAISADGTRVAVVDPTTRNGSESLDSLQNSGRLAIWAA